MTFRERIFPTWVRVTSSSRPSVRRTTERGRWAQTGAVICAAIGVDTDLTLLYQLFAFLLAMIVVGRFSLRFQIPEVSVKRHLPQYATANETFRYHITVRNLGQRIEQDLRLMDTPLTVAPTLAEYQANREPGEETRNAWDRFIGWHRFAWLQRRKTGLGVGTAQVPPVSLRGSVDVELKATPLRRGVVTLQSIAVLRPDPFGLCYGVQQFSQLEQILVMPKRYRVSSNLVSAGGRHFQPGGVNPSWSIGESHEFVSMRDYRDGDSLRKIHWASSAKRAKPVVKEYQDEYFVRQALVLDTHSHHADALEEAVAVAASLALQYDPTDSLLDLIFSQSESQLITAGRGYNLVNKQLEALATLTGSEQPFQVTADAAIAHAALASGVTLVLTAWDEERQALRDQLRGRGINTRTLVISATDPNEEAEPDLHFLTLGKVAEQLERL